MENHKHIFSFFLKENYNLHFIDSIFNFPCAQLIVKTCQSARFRDDNIPILILSNNKHERL